MQIFNQAQTLQHLPFPELIQAIEQMFIEGCTVPLRHSHVVEGAGDAAGGIMLLMPDTALSSSPVPSGSSRLHRR